jgi:hypothetical protein
MKPIVRAAQALCKKSPANTSSCELGGNTASAWDAQETANFPRNDHRVRLVFGQEPLLDKSPEPCDV